MRNSWKSQIATILEVAKRLPYFTLDDLASIETNKQYLRVVLSRYARSGKIVRLKKGIYVAKEYLGGIEKSGRLVIYGEFLAGVLYKPSYLSLEYVLHKYGVITESPNVMTVVSRNKTAKFLTPFGLYRYYSIAGGLFTGFVIR